MKNNFYHYILLSFLIVISSCQYDLSEDFYKNIDKTTPSVNIDFVDFYPNKVFKKYTDVEYNFTNSKHKLYQIDFFIDDSKTFTSNSKNGNFPIDVFNLEEGEHSLKVEYYISSGTNSLADINDSEVYKVFEEFSFFIDKSIAEPFAVNKVEILNGSLFISWDEVKDTNFNEAYIVIEKNGYYDSEYLLNQETIDGKIYNDTINTSGELTYYIKLTNDFKSSNGIGKSITVNHPEIKKEIIDYKKVKLNWEQHPLYNNFDYYKFDNYINNYQVLELDKNGGEITIDVNLFFGKTYILGFELMKKTPYLNRVNSFSEKINIGEEFLTKYCKKYIFSALKNRFYAVQLIGSDYYQSVRKVVIHELDPDDLSLLKTTEIKEITDSFVNLTIDPNSNNLIIDLKEESIILDIDSYNVLNTFNANDYSNNQPYWPETIVRNNTLILKGKSNGDSTKIYNLQTKNLIHTFNNVRFIKISDNGKYLALNESIYMINSNSLTKIASTYNNQNIHSIAFINNKDKCIYTTLQNTPVLLDLNNKNSETLNELSNSYALGYDTQTNKVLSYQQYNVTPPSVQVLSLDTREVETVKIENIHYTNTYFTVQNNKIIYSPGFYLNLK